MKRKIETQYGIIIVSDKWIPLYGANNIKSLINSIKEEINCDTYSFEIRTVKDEFVIHMKDIVFNDYPIENTLTHKVRFVDFEMFFDKYCEAKNYPKEGYIYGFEKPYNEEDAKDPRYVRANNVIKKLLEYED